jgi:hypothetical protein
MRHRRFAAVLAVALLLVAGAARADDEDQAEMLAGGAWTRGPLVPCADGVVGFIGPRLEEPKPYRFDSGVQVVVRLPSTPRWLNNQKFVDARVVHYQDSPGNDLLAHEKTGDRVQVCLVSFPTPRHDPKSGGVLCDPNVDPRGITFRIYDYARKAAYVGPDSQHSCGGA